MPCGKNRNNEEDVPLFQVYFIPADKAKEHALTKDFFNQQSKFAFTSAAAATILIPLAVHAGVGLLSHVSSTSQKAHVLDLQREVLLQGCFDACGKLLLEDSFLAFSVGGTLDEETGIAKDPILLAIFQIIVSPDKTAIRLLRKKWTWKKFLQPPERSFWTCQSLKFRDFFIGIEFDYLSEENNAMWEFVFSNQTEEDLDTLMDESTDWAPAPVLPDDFNENGENVIETNDSLEAQQQAIPAKLSSDAIETTLEEPIPSTDSNNVQATPANKTPKTRAQYLVPANIKVEVIETTRPHVLAPLLQQGAKAGSSVAGSLSKVITSKIKV